MAYTDKSADFIVDKFFTYIDADELAENDKHLQLTIAAEHSWNGASVDGAHTWLGSWDSSNNFNTIYQATTNLIIMASAYNGDDTSSVSARTDSSSSPTTKVAEDDSEVGESCSVTFVVKKDDYWEVVAGNGNILSVISLGA